MLVQSKKTLQHRVCRHRVAMACSVSSHLHDASCEQRDKGYYHCVSVELTFSFLILFFYLFVSVIAFDIIIIAYIFTL